MLGRVGCGAHGCEGGHHYLPPRGPWYAVDEGTGRVIVDGAQHELEALHRLKGRAPLPPDSVGIYKVEPADILAEALRAQTEGGDL